MDDAKVEGKGVVEVVVVDGVVFVKGRRGRHGGRPVVRPEVGRTWKACPSWVDGDDDDDGIGGGEEEEMEKEYVIGVIVVKVAGWVLAVVSSSDEVVGVKVVELPGWVGKKEAVVAGVWTGRRPVDFGVEELWGAMVALVSIGSLVPPLSQTLIFLRGLLWSANQDRNGIINQAIRLVIKQ